MWLALTQPIAQDSVGCWLLHGKRQSARVRVCVCACVRGGGGHLVHAHEPTLINSDAMGTES